MMSEWAKTAPADGNSRMRHYAFDKLACGLLSRRLYAKHPHALDLVEKAARYAQRSLKRGPRTITPSHNSE